jgi:hypothetical protein
MNYKIEEIKNKLENILKGITEREQEYYENQNWYMRQKQTTKRAYKKKIYATEELRCMTARHELTQIKFDLQNLINEVSK